jgi:hypothetical protein
MAAQQEFAEPKGCLLMGTKTDLILKLSSLKAFLAQSTGTTNGCS